MTPQGVARLYCADRSLAAIALSEARDTASYPPLSTLDRVSLFTVEPGLTTPEKNEGDTCCLESFYPVASSRAPTPRNQRSQPHQETGR